MRAVFFSPPLLLVAFDSDARFIQKMYKLLKETYSYVYACPITGHDGLGREHSGSTTCASFTGSKPFLPRKPNKVARYILRTFDTLTILRMITCSTKVHRRGTKLSICLPRPRTGNASLSIVSINITTKIKRTKKRSHPDVKAYMSCDVVGRDYPTKRMRFDHH